MQRIYTSNLYWNVDPSPLRIKVYLSHLKGEVDEQNVWRKIKELSSEFEEAYMSVVTNRRLYSSSRDLMNELSDYIEQITLTTITNDNNEHSKVIGLLLLRSIELFLRRRGCVTVGSKLERRKRIFFLEDDSLFVLKIDKKEATFKAIRGLTPKIYAGNIPGSIYLFLTPDGVHRIEVRDWSSFIGEEVKVRRRYLEGLERRNHSGIFRIIKLKENNAILLGLRFGEKIKVPLSEIYIPEKPPLLHKFGVYEILQAFTSFKEKEGTEQMTEYRFLEASLERILPDKEGFILKVGLTPINFRRVRFEPVEEVG